MLQGELAVAGTRGAVPRVQNRMCGLVAWPQSVCAVLCVNCWVRRNDRLCRAAFRGVGHGNAGNGQQVFACKRDAELGRSAVPTLQTRLRVESRPRQTRWNSQHGHSAPENGREESTGVNTGNSCIAGSGSPSLKNKLPTLLPPKISSPFRLAPSFRGIRCASHWPSRLQSVQSGSPQPGKRCFSGKE